LIPAAISGRGYPGYFSPIDPALGELRLRTPDIKYKVVSREMDKAKIVIN